MKPLRIARTRCEVVSRLSAAQRDVMFALMIRYYTGMTREGFDRDLDEKQHVLCLYAADRELVGFSTIQVLHSIHQGRKVVTLFSGDTVVDERCWGQKKMQRAFTRYLVWLRVRYPLRKVYWFLISKGHKTYLLMCNNLLMFPNHRGRTPTGAQAALDHVAGLKYPEDYDRERGVIVSSGAAIKDDLAADLSPTDLENPDIRYFCERNPNWRQGDELCCLADVRWRELSWSVSKYAVVYPLLALFGRNPRQRRSAPRAVVGSSDGGSA